MPYCCTTVCRFNTMTSVSINVKFLRGREIYPRRIIKRLRETLYSTTVHKYTIIMAEEETLSSQSSKSSKNRSMFADGFTERRDLEQYFWTEETVHKLMDALRYQFDPCCLGTPSLAHAWHVEEKRAEWLYDIDERFKYLPKFRYYDIRAPEDVDETFRIIICDPPFFYIPMEEIFAAVERICKGNFNTKILIGFLKREEAILLKTFAPFGLRKTNFPLEYAHVKPNKWKNYALYSNIDLPGIKRIRK